MSTTPPILTARTASGTAPALSRTRPLSPQHRIVADAWHRATVALGFAITSREMRAHWTTYGQGPLSPSFFNIVRALLDAGVLTPVAGGVGYRRYVHAAAPHVAPMPPDDATFMGAVLTALRLAAAQAGRYVSTSEVIEAMLTHGLVASLTNEQRTLAWQVLVAAAKPVVLSVSPRVEEDGPVRVALTERITASDAKRRQAYWWCPSEMDFSEPVAGKPSSQREAVTITVEAARAALAIPPTMDELTLYLMRRFAEDPMDPMLELIDLNALSRSVATAFRPRNTTGSGVEWAGLERVRTPFWVGRLTPNRLALPPVTLAEMQRATAGDAFLRLAPGRELEWLAGIEAQAGAAIPALADLLTLRRTLLQRRLLAIMTPAEWQDALASLEHTMLTLDRWIGELPGRTKWKHLARRIRRSMAPREQDLRAVAEVLRWPLLDIPKRFEDLGTITEIGDGISVPYDAFPFVQAALLTAGVPGEPDRRVHPIFTRARRVPAPPGTKPSRETPKSAPVVMEQVDRVDTYAIAVAAAGAVMTGTYVADATALLGTLIRDPRVVVRLLTDPELPGWMVRGLLVAQGMLADSPDPARWTTTPDHVAAGLLATVLADPDAAGPTVRRLLADLPDSCFQLGMTGLGQAEAGEWLALVG